MFHDRTSKVNAVHWLLHLAGATIVISTVVVVYFTACASFAWQSSVRNQQIMELSTYLRRSFEIRKSHATLKQTLLDREQQFQQIDQRIPSEPNEAKFLQQTTEAAAQVGLTIHDYRRGHITKKDDHYQLEVRILGEGKYSSICHFFSHIQNLPRVVAIDRLLVDANNSQGTYPIDLTLLLYYRGSDLSTGEKEKVNG